MSYTGIHIFNGAMHRGHSVSLHIAITDNLRYPHTINLWFLIIFMQ